MIKLNGNGHALNVTEDVAVWDFAPRSDWTEMSDTEHFVQFYEDDGFLLNSLSGFIGKALDAGEGALVVATKSHRDGLDELLEANGTNVTNARVSGHYVSLDAAETLSKFMVDGSPEPGRFAEVIGSVLANLRNGKRQVRAFGEMVAILWAEGNYTAAIRLEELWNELQQTHSFSLFCAYPMNGLAGEKFVEPHSRVCKVHSRIIPAESYAEITNPDARLRAVAQLQQKARSLEAVKNELEVQVEDLRRLHEMSLRLTSTLDVECVLQEVLRAAMAVQDTDLGLLSLCDPESDGLKVEVSSGFAEKFLKRIESVPPGGGACGTCYQQRQRVVVEDVEVDPIFAPYRDAAREAGFRACHSTPLITRNENIIGVLSVHFRQPRRPVERETRLIDLYARMAADFIENARLHQRVQEELTEREQLLTREQMARAEAETANRMKDEFLATVSHELRTPLNAIIGWTHMLRSGRLDEANVVRAVETIERNAKSQAQLIEDILDVSRVITGQLRLNTGPVDLASVINSSIDSVQLAAESKDIHLEVTLAPTARHAIGDSNRLQQVVWNLLSNAIKFTPNGGRVEVRLEPAGANVKIKVSDSGQGISANFLPFIFDRFRQADGTSTRRHGGLGLGLAIVRHLVELHGGTVQADSAGEDLGATFTVSLPLATAPDSPKGRKQRRGRLWSTGPATTELGPLPTLADIQVLLVDDDPDTLQVLSVMLREYQAEVQAVGSAAEAIEVMEWFEPDVVVSDLAMPDEDGYSLIAKIRSLDASSGNATPAVALTSYVRVEDRSRALAAGFNMFVPKPVQPNELITAVANVVDSLLASG